MKNFTLESSMIAPIGGTFYPRGFTMVMFPDAADAQRVGQAIIDGGVSGDEVFLIPPDTVLTEIGATIRDADEPLPSPGMETSIVRNYVQLARDGHTALLVRTPDAAAAEQLMALARGAPYSIARRYHLLAIEEL